MYCQVKKFFHPPKYNLLIAERKKKTDVKLLDYQWISVLLSVVTEEKEKNSWAQILKSKRFHI